MPIGPVKAKLTPKLPGLWALPRSKSSNRYHFFESGSEWCLCRSWHREQVLLRDGEARIPLAHVDAKKCVSVYKEHIRT